VFFLSFFLLMDGRERRRCALLSLGSPKLTFTHTLSIYARGAARSALRTSPLSRLGRWLHFVSLCGCWPFFFERSVSLRENALVIHYTRNDHVLRDGELVLMDAGGEYKCAVSMRHTHSLTHSRDRLRVFLTGSGYASDICESNQPTLL